MTNAKHGSAHEHLVAAIEAVRFAPGNIVHFCIIKRLQRKLIIEALRQTNGNVSRAARLLGIPRDKLRYQIKILRLQARAPAHSS
jgi:DNA-binding NtrC family response regulator